MRWNEIYDELKEQFQINCAGKEREDYEPEPDEIQSRYMQLAFGGGPVDLTN